MVVWGIGSDDDYDALVDFRDQMGLTFPVLYDADGAVHAAYQQQAAYENTVYPQDWIVGTDGRVAFVANEYLPDDLRAVLEAELAGE